MEEREVGPTLMQGVQPRRKAEMAAAARHKHSRGSCSAGVDSAVGRLQTPHQRGPGNSPESGEQLRVWGGGAERERMGRREGRESGLLPAPLSTLTLTPGREERTQWAAR